MSALLIAASGIPLAPPLHTRLIAFIIVEAVLLVLVIASYLKYKQLKAVSTDDWFAERDKHASPRVKRMMQESHEQWESEVAAAEKQTQEDGAADA